MKSICGYSTILFFAMACGLCLNLLTTTALAQQGYNAVCSSTTGCSTTSASGAFIDASAFCTASNCSGQDFCQQVNKALFALPLSGGVVDARGINPGGPNSCTGTTPYVVSGQHTISTPSILLLPSGSIKVNTTWVIPDRSRIIGQGNNPNATNIMGTDIQASGMADNAVMMEMGSPGCDDGVSGQCYGVSISNLTLNGADGLTAPNNKLIGIQNLNSGESSYVDHVNLEQFGGIALYIGGQATGSGPYSNISISPIGECTSTTVGVQIGDTNGELVATRGIHGLTATCTTSAGLAAILLDSPNNTLEDLHFEGFGDGIRVGSLVPASGSTIHTQGNVILNVNGGTSNTDVMNNVVHVCSPTNGTVCGSSNNVVSDLSIVGVSATRSCGSNSCDLVNVIEDELTDSNIPFLPQLQTSAGFYVVGEASPGGVTGTNSYAKFANTPVSGISTWQVGSSAPTSPCQAGSLFSNTAGSGSKDTIFACSGTAWVGIK